MADSFLVLVPHKTLHGTISILIQRPKLATNVGKMGAVKNKMPFIPQCPGPAQSAAAEMPGDGRFSKPTLFHRQGMRPHAELHQQPYPGNGHWKLKVRQSFQLTGRMAGPTWNSRYFVSRRKLLMCSALAALQASCCLHISTHWPPCSKFRHVSNGPLVALGQSTAAIPIQEPTCNS